ncbi:MAG: 50S ribosomal protein L10 [Candidatus Woesearchaeota archaeon]
MSEKTTKAPLYKKNIIKKISDLVKAYPIIAVANMENLPSPQLATMRKQLRGKIEIFMTKRRLILKALDNIKDKPGLEKLKQELKGMPALVFTKENPFSLFKTLKKSKSKAPAKPGQIAPYDIIVPAGPTPFTPGPIIGELGALGIKAGVEGGKIAIKTDSMVCAEGKPISEKLAGLLVKLGIEPMEIGLNVTAVYENGTIYPKSVLDIDEEKFMQDIMMTANQAYGLALEIRYTTKETVELLLQKAEREAKALEAEEKSKEEPKAAEQPK